jgi:hypothetical protein
MDVPEKNDLVVANGRLQESKRVDGSAGERGKKTEEDHCAYLLNSRLNTPVLAVDSKAWASSSMEP